MTEEYDIIVVGAGPAGSMAAIEASRLGLKTLVIDRKTEIGAPVRCGENIGEKSLKDLGITPEDEWVDRYLVRQHYIVKERRMTSQVRTYQINRKLFEQWLAKKAIRSGADYRIRTELHALVREKGALKGIDTMSHGRPEKFRGKLIIAADGVDSLTAKMAGFPTENFPKDYAAGFQYHMSGLALDDPDAVLFYVDKNALGGYIWIFPRSEDSANVGIGMVPKKGLPGVRILLNNFIKARPEIFEKAEMVELVSGGVPLTYPFPALVDDNFMLIGDAGHFVSAISGGGMSWAMFSAREAVRTAAAAIEAGDCSRSSLMPYQEGWLAGKGKTLRFYYKVRRFAENFDDATIDKATAILSKKDLDKVAKKGRRFYWSLIPRKLPKAMPFAWGYYRSSRAVEKEIKEEERQIREKCP